MKHPRIVVLGGGTGSFTLLQGIKQLTPNVTAIVNMSDDGGSTGTLRDGWKTVAGEDNISKYTIRHANPRVWLEPVSGIHPRAADAIMQADIVVIAPGNFYGSLTPICLVQGVAKALQDTPARVVSVTNLVNKPGQTNGWHVVDYVQHLEKYLGEGVIDVALYNAQPIKAELLKAYAAEGEFPVDTTPGRFKELKAKAIGVLLVDREIAQQDPADTLLRRTLIRHDPKRVVTELEKLLAD
jgi:uncharacterized cofD-like protein